jgi:hypothetical protein
MGHYASEMDPNWGKPTGWELKLAEVEDEKVKNLARCLFRGFNSGSHLDISNSEHGVDVAKAIDSLVRERIAEALGSNADQTE